mmetsp:Transcript_11334/g.38629  ORF Transcript_11334/g.38629 Transcript_11334/m.38629 type:complete len:241 (-) Transcript_11334:202-924(-)
MAGWTWSLKRNARPRAASRGPRRPSMTALPTRRRTSGGCSAAWASATRRSWPSAGRTPSAGPSRSGLGRWLRAMAGRRGLGTPGRAETARGRTARTAWACRGGDPGRSGGSPSTTPTTRAAGPGAPARPARTRSSSGSPQTRRTTPTTRAAGPGAPARPARTRSSSGSPQTRRSPRIRPSAAPSSGTPRTRLHSWRTLPRPTPSSPTWVRASTRRAACRCDACWLRRAWSPVPWQRPRHG